jgi:hypothetical protein
VGFAVEHAVSLLNRGEADRLRQMALAGAGRTEEQRVLSLLDEALRRQLGDEATVKAGTAVAQDEPPRRRQLLPWKPE